MQQKENNKRGLFLWKTGSMKPVVRTGISEVKPRISSSSEWCVSSGAKEEEEEEEEEEEGWGKGSKDEAYVESLHREFFFIWSPRKYRMGSMPKMCKFCTHRLCGLRVYQNDLCAWNVQEMTDIYCGRVMLGKFHCIILIFSWSQWPRGLRRRSLAARLLRLWVRIPPRAWMFVCCECCVLSGRGLCDGLITRPEESYRLWRVVVCDQETSYARRL